MTLNGHSAYLPFAQVADVRWGVAGLSEVAKLSHMVGPAHSSLSNVWEQPAPVSMEYSVLPGATVTV